MKRKSMARPSLVDLYDEATLLPRTVNGIRLPDGRALAWAEYGSPQKVPCVLLPDTGSSRLAPLWLLHDTAVPPAGRLLALDRPGIGASDPVGLGQEDPTEDLRHLVEVLAVGQVAVIGVGQGAAEALTFAARYGPMVTTVIMVSPRLPPEQTARRHILRPLTWSAAVESAGPAAAWLQAAGRGADLTTRGTWERAVRRMGPTSARMIGDRWHDSDFRHALAADLDQAGRSWITEPVTPWPNWQHFDCPVPVHIWHGRDETDAMPERLLTVADQHNWQITAVDDYSALFGAWNQILHTATDSFHQASA